MTVQQPAEESAPSGPDRRPAMVESCHDRRRDRASPLPSPSRRPCLRASRSRLPTQRDAVGAEPAPPGEVPPSSALVASTGSAADAGLIAPEVQQLAVQMAEEFFRPWELALREQFEAEIALRLEFELEHHERQAESLAGELAERRVMFEGTWTSAHPRGSTTDTAKWEMEQTIRRQAAELEENERTIQEIRERLRELGQAPEESTVTVYDHGEVPEPMAAAPPPDVEDGLPRGARRSGRSTGLTPPERSLPPDPSLETP